MSAAQRNKSGLLIVFGLTLAVLLANSVLTCRPIARADDLRVRLTDDAETMEQPADEPVPADEGPPADPFVDDRDEPDAYGPLPVDAWVNPSPKWTVRAEYLAWWMKGNRAPPLVTTSDDNAIRADAGVIGRDATTVLLGDGRLDDGLRHGGRVSLVRWFGQDSTLGMEVSLLGLGGDDTHFTAASGGLPILARPFHNVLTGAEHAQLVAYPNVIDGAVHVDTSSELYSAAVLLRTAWRRGPNADIDVVGGYRYLGFREGLFVTENLISRDPQGDVQIGTAIDVHDAFRTETDFHGGEIGLAARFGHCNFSLDATTTLAIGGVRQQAMVDGYTTVTTPGDPAQTAGGGLLALDTNRGEFQRDGIAFVPQLDLTLNCQLTQRLTVRVGYSLLYLTRAFRAGDQIDYRVNPTLLPNSIVPVTGELRPEPQVHSTSFWAQGISAGTVLVF